MSDQYEVTGMEDTFRTYINTSASEPPVGALTEEMLSNYIREVTMATGRYNLSSPVEFISDFSSPDAEWPSFDTEQYNYVYQNKKWEIVSDAEPEPRPGIETLSMIGFK